MKSFLVLPILFILGFTACKDERIVSKIPKLSFNSTSIYQNKFGKDSLVVLNIGYEDGDGNIGLSESDTFPPFNYGNTAFYNLYVTYLVKNNNIWEAIVYPGTNDTINFNQRFPVLNLSKKDKIVSGSMDIFIPASPYPGIKPTEVKFLLRMKDKSLNLSNIVESGAIKLTQ